MREYDRGEKPDANAKTPTAASQKHLEDTNPRKITNTNHKHAPDLPNNNKHPLDDAQADPKRHHGNHSQLHHTHTEITPDYNSDHLCAANHTPIEPNNAKTDRNQWPRTTHKALDDKLNTNTTGDTTNNKNLRPGSTHDTNTRKTQARNNDNQLAATHTQRPPRAPNTSSNINGESHKQ